MQLRKLVFVIALAVGGAGCVGHRSFKTMCGVPQEVEEYSCWGGDSLPDGTGGSLDGMEIDISDPCYSLESCQPHFVRGIVVQYPPENK